MNTILTSHKQNKLDKAAEKFMCRHPRIAFFTLFIGMPILILIAVFVGTTLIMFPISWIMGWL